MTQLQLTKGYKVVISRLDKPMQAASLRRTAPPQKHAAGAAEGPDRRETMNRMIDGWLAASAARHKRSTHAAYETVADRHIRPALGGCRVSELTADQLADFLMKKAAGGRGSSRWRRRRWAASSRCCAPCCSMQRPGAAPSLPGRGCRARGLRSGRCAF